MANLRVVLAWQLVAVCAATTAVRAQQSTDTLHRDAVALAPATLIGRVTDSIGAGLVGAEITLLHSDRVHTITSDSGDFRITGLEPGTVVFNVRRIGFEAASFTGAGTGGGGGGVDTVPTVKLPFICDECGSQSKK